MALSADLTRLRIERERKGNRGRANDGDAAKSHANTVVAMFLKGGRKPE